MSEFMQSVIPNSERLIDFGIGRPSKSMLNTELIKKSVKKIIDSNILDNYEILQYSNVSGLENFRRNLSIFINDKLSSLPDNNNENYYLQTMTSDCSKENLIISGGITGAVQLIIESMCFPDEVLLVEEKTYFLMISIFKDFGLNLKCVASDENGIDINDLIEKVQEINENQDKVFLYCIPFYHNPTGRSFSDENILDLMKVFDIYENFFVLSDEVYYFLNWEKNKIFPLAFYHSNFVSLGSFSKTLAPSLRIGYILTFDEEFIDDIKNNSVLDSSGGISVFNSLIVNELITNLRQDYDNNLNEIINQLKTRKEYMIAQLERCNKEIEESGYQLKFSNPNGGYFLWVTVIGDNLEESFLDNLKDECKINKVTFLQGPNFAYNMSTDPDIKMSFRLSYSVYNIDEIFCGIERIKNTLLNLNCTRIISFSKENNNIVSELKKSLDNFSTLRFYKNILPDCSNLEDTIISKYNNTIIINFEGNKILEFIKKINKSMNEHINTDSTQLYHGKIKIINPNLESINSLEDKDIIEFSKSNSMYISNNYSEMNYIESVIKKLLKDQLDITMQNVNTNSLNSMSDSNKSIDLTNDSSSIVSINLKLNKLIPNINESMDVHQIIKILIFMLKQYNGIYFEDETIFQKFFTYCISEKNYMIVDTNDLHCNYSVDSIHNMYHCNDNFDNFLLGDKFFKNVEKTILICIQNESIKEQIIKGNFYGKFSIIKPKNSNFCSNWLIFYVAVKFYYDKYKVNCGKIKLDKSEHLFEIKDDIIYKQSVGTPIFIKTESIAKKIREITNDFENLNILGIETVSVCGYLTIIIEFSNDLNDIESCILIYYRNLLSEEIDKKLRPKKSIVFVNKVNDNKFITLGFDENLHSIVSIYKYFTEKSEELDSKNLNIENQIIFYLCSNENMKITEFLMKHKEKDIYCGVNIKLISDSEIQFH